MLGEAGLFGSHSGVLCKRNLNVRQRFVLGAFSITF